MSMEEIEHAIRTHRQQLRGITIEVRPSGKPRLNRAFRRQHWPEASLPRKKALGSGRTVAKWHYDEGGPSASTSNIACTIIARALSDRNEREGDSTDGRDLESVYNICLRIYNSPAAARVLRMNITLPEKRWVGPVGG